MRAWHEVYVRDKIHYIITAQIIGRRQGVISSNTFEKDFLYKEDGTYIHWDSDVIRKYFLVFEKNEVAGISGLFRVIHNDKVIEGVKLQTRASFGIASISSNLFIYYKTYQSGGSVWYIKEMVYLEGDTYRVEPFPTTWIAESEE